MPDSSGLPALPSREVLSHIVDVHCHPTDSPLDHEAFSTLPHRVCAMATRGTDQPLVAELARHYPDKVIPCFGYHPWFTHWISLDDKLAKEAHYRSLFLTPKSKPEHEAAFLRLLPYLPDPTPLSKIMSSLRADLTMFPHAMLGEVGLDRSCRVPYSPPTSPPYASRTDRDDGRELSPFTIPLFHQISVLEAQLGLAVELKRNVSIHSVKSPQATLELLARMKAKYGQTWENISVDMHSCGLSIEMWLAIERAHRNLFLSLSTAINCRSPAYTALLQGCSPNRILVESDFHDIAHSAPMSWDMVCRVAKEKQWTVEEAVKKPDKELEDVNADIPRAVHQLARNWQAFVKGGHSSPADKEEEHLY